ncbi:MAG: hypothetical protein H6581_15170 [Bacteroidia bacterium]|nr:hypothetical protein [Bacteroidia bacterium]
MKKNYLLLGLLLLLGVNLTFGQQQIRCFTVENEAWHRQQNPGMETPEQFESWLDIKMHEYQQDLAAGRAPAVITIPVVVHVIHNGDAVGSGENISQAQVNSQIDVLNEDFRKMAGTNGFGNGVDTEIQFCMATEDPSGNPLSEPGIHRVNMGQSSWTSNSSVETTLKPQTSWDPTRYCNIWVCKFGAHWPTCWATPSFPILPVCRASIPITATPTPTGW